MAHLALSTEEILRRLVNLSQHPKFQEQTELPAWQVLIDAAKENLGIENDDEEAV